MRRDRICGWCKKTDELIPMEQGGWVHTICPDCGSTGPVVEFAQFDKAYMRLRKLRNRLEKIIAQIDAEPMATSEPAESGQLGRLQIRDELQAILGMAG